MKNFKRENLIFSLWIEYPLKEKAAYAANLFQETAAAKNITLKLHRKK